jgi:hypothetical protein
MRPTLRLSLVSAAALAAASFVRGQGTLQVSNLGQAPTGSAPIASDSWIAQSISTGTSSAGYVLNSVQLLMDTPSGAPSGFSVSIYSSLGGQPQNDLGTLTGTDPSAGGVFTYSASDISLSPSTFYFVVLTADSTSAQGAYTWSAAANPSTGGIDLWIINNTYESSPDGANWTGHSRQDVFQMAIYATPAPEPGVFGLVAVGGLIVGMRRRIAKCGVRISD